MPGARPVHEVKANLFRVLGHPARVRILELLREGERSVGALQAELGLDSASQDLVQDRGADIAGKRSSQSAPFVELRPGFVTVPAGECGHGRQKRHERGDKPPKGEEPGGSGKR